MFCCSATNLCSTHFLVPCRNLQAAVGAYYDFYGPVTMPAISAKDVTLCPGQKVPPNTSLSKVWRVSNTGTAPGT